MLSFDPEKVPLPAGHLIGGKIHFGNGERISVNRPSDGQFLGEIPDGDAELVNLAVTNAHQSWLQSGWGTRSPRERAKCCAAGQT